MRAFVLCVGGVLLGLVGCTSEVDRGAAEELAVSPEDKYTTVPGDDGDDGGCPPGTEALLSVTFDCETIYVRSTCHDLSNVVIELADGTRQRFEGLTSLEGSFSGGGPIVRVWVKAGANASGDGPGYGERFEVPIDTCPTPI